MFAHQVIESISAWGEETKKVLGGQKFWDAMVLNIQQSQKFSLGNSGTIEQMSSKHIGDMLFQGTHGGVRLPYKKTWIDYDRYGLHDSINTYSDAPWRKTQHISRKRAVLLIELLPDVILSYVFNYFNTRRSWDVSAVSNLIFIDTNLGAHENKDIILNALSKYYKTTYQFISESFIPIPLIATDWNTIIRFHKENTDELMTANTVLLLLSCKNISTETINPPVSLNKKRIKKGKQPLFTYKTLVVKPTGKKQESIPKHLWENRIHLQRGHFKTYTEDKPLFGRLTGRYWWQPSVRGRNTDGVVMKDYLVHGKEAL